jgi:hypothetical protein
MPNLTTSSIDEFVNRRFSSFAIYLFSVTCDGSRLALSRGRKRNAENSQDG